VLRLPIVAFHGCRSRQRQAGSLIHTTYSVGAVVFSVFAVISAMAFVGQFGDSGQRSGQSFNIFPALFALGWGSGAHRLWNPKP
jgi:hypothetical protein